MYELGLVSISFRNHTPEEILKAMKKADLSVIEWGSDVHAPCDDFKKIKEIVALQEKYQIKCCSYGTYFRMGTNKPEEIIPYISAAKALGTNVLRIWCGCSCPEKCKKCGKHNLLGEAQQLAEIAEKENVILCLECHHSTYTEDLNPISEMLKKINSPNFQMYWQPNQYKDFNTNIYYAEKIASYVKIVHVFNWDGDNRLPLNNAVDTWREYLKVIGKEIPLLLEFMPDGDINSLNTEADALKIISK